MSGWIKIVMLSISVVLLILCVSVGLVVSHFNNEIYSRPNSQSAAVSNDVGQINKTQNTDQKSVSTAPKKIKYDMVPYDYRTIQEALDDPNSTNKIIVYPGVYSGNINFNGNGKVLTSYKPDNSEVVASTVIKGDVISSALNSKGEKGSYGLVGLTIKGGFRVEDNVDAGKGKGDGKAGIGEKK